MFNRGGRLTQFAASVAATGKYATTKRHAAITTHYTARVNWTPGSLHEPENVP